jgi:hypothetical protein
MKLFGTVLDGESATCLSQMSGSGSAKPFFA